MLYNSTSYFKLFVLSVFPFEYFFAFNQEEPLVMSCFIKENADELSDAGGVANIRLRGY